MAYADFGTLCTIAGVTGKVINVDPPPLSVGVIETTNHSSANWREYIADTLKGAAAFTITMEVGATVVGQLITVWSAFAPVEIVFTEASMPAWTFDGIIKDLKYNAANASTPAEEIITVTIQPTGAIGVAAAPGDWYDDVTAFYFGTGHLAILDGNTYQVVVYAVVPGMAAHLVTAAEITDLTFADDGAGAVASVDANGLLTANGAGDAVITCTAPDPLVNGAFLVTVT